MGPLTLSDSVARFLAWGKLRFQPATVAFYRTYLGKFCEKYPDRNISDISTIDIETWSAKRHPLLCVKRFFSWCVVKAGFLSIDPAKGVQLPRGGRRSRTLQPAECARLRRRAAPALRAYLLAAEETGARPHELRNATWAHVHQVGGGAWNVTQLVAGRCMIRLDKYKGQARRENPFVPRIIPISARFGRLLARLAVRSASPDDPLLRGARGRAWSCNGLRCAFRRLRAALKMAGDNGPERIVVYSYRHTLATRLARAGVNHRVLADFLGHAGTNLLSWYVHPTEADLSKLVEREEKKRKGKGPPDAPGLPIT